MTHPESNPCGLPHPSDSRLGRAQNVQVPQAFSRCPTCHFTYITTDKPRDTQREAWNYLRFSTLLTRDLVACLFIIQIGILAFAWLLRICDRKQKIPEAFPATWAASHADDWGNFGIGPYYVAGVFCALVIIGLVGCCIGAYRGDLNCGGLWLPECPCTLLRSRSETECGPVSAIG
jgi:hypothetical protein